MHVTRIVTTYARAYLYISLYDKNVRSAVSTYNLPTTP